VLQTVDHFEISCFGASFSWLEKPGNRMGRDLDCMADVLMGFYRSTFSKPNTATNWTTSVEFPAGAVKECFISPQRPDRLWGRATQPHMYWLSPGGKAAGV
jgi:hypothetical protein